MIETQDASLFAMNIVTVVNIVNIDRRSMQDVQNVLAASSKPRVLQMDVFPVDMVDDESFLF